ncbi:unnamed protein product [marine sediment metagenome]|uniref:Uncharacterized protein n=1 Tax=marine sediment metagenome TaxID=412755 RepID=X1Q3F7_9ZZZZ
MWTVWPTFPLNGGTKQAPGKVSSRSQFFYNTAGKDINREKLSPWPANNDQGSK